MTRIGVTRFIAECVIGHAETRGARVAAIYDRNDYLREEGGGDGRVVRPRREGGSGEKKRADVLPMSRA